MRPEPFFNLQYLIFQLFTQWIRSASPIDAGFNVSSIIYCHRDQLGRSGFSDSSGFPVVLAFRSLQLRCHSGYSPVKVVAVTKNKRNLKVLSNGAGGGGEWYQSIHFDKLVCRKVFFFGPKGTPSREEHKTSGSVLTIFSVALTYWCRKIRQNFSP